LKWSVVNKTLIRDAAVLCIDNCKIFIGYDFRSVRAGWLE
jgi:hypothetical protein